MNASQLEALILAKTRRVVVSGEPGDGSAAARQFDTYPGTSDHFFC